ncbi:diguanylate cyclase [Campylobacter sp. FMV-PI01]|uniref:Diguanylate cyclase n=1 Tax=Campylobacter portucalensis TaxID=2608384 RepID=A0A6L5WFZ9_9BACT|nr:diguanylate cyclase [Campylobacter portucalensis]MSN95829.1 diguanylate cyclase [Campylobacter portucalensis]
MKNCVEQINHIKNRNSNYMKLVSDLGKNLVNNSLAYFEIQIFFKKMAHYSANQFEDILNLMHNYQIDERQVQIHKTSQDKFIKELSVLCSKIEEDTNNVRILLNFLIYFADFKILKQDEILLQQILLINSGKSPKEAFEMTNLINFQTDTVKIFNEILDSALLINQKFKEENSNLLNEIKIIKTKSLELSKKYATIPTFDPLTNLPNQIQATKGLEISIKNSEQFNQKLATILININEYSYILNNFGTDKALDVVLIVVDLLKASIRSGDILYSIRQDEFLIICQNTNETGAINIANNIFKNIKNNNQLKNISKKFKSEFQDFEITLNIGIVVSKNSMSVDEINHKLSKNLEISKANGVNTFQI